MLFILIVVLLALSGSTGGQLVPSQYVDFLPGTLNVIISSPHGGDLAPSSIPDRDYGCFVDGSCVWSHDCGTKDPDNCDASTSKDLHTQELTRELRESMFSEFGAYPPTVINLLHRSKHDANREANEATFGVPEAVEAWNYYHGLLGELRQNQTKQALVLDIHGHGHDMDWVELGYLVSSSELDSGNYNAADTSVQSLFSSTTGVSTIQELLSGQEPISFGALLESEGFLSVPSSTHPGPDGRPYYSGGYITQQYGSRDGGTVDAIQIESPMVFREEPQRAPYVAAITSTVRAYLNRHYV